MHAPHTPSTGATPRVSRVSSGSLCQALDSQPLLCCEQITSCIILPMATGMAIANCLSCIARDRPTASKVLWPRIDQKTCLKAILSAGLTPVVIENVLVGDEVSARA